MKAKSILFVVFFCVIGATAAFGAGFGLYEYGSRGNALGGSMYAMKADPSSIAVNPAQLARLSGTQVDGGVTMITASADTSYDGHKTSAKDQTWYVPNFYFTHQITDNLSAGVMVNSRFGLGNEYDKNWPGAIDTYKVDLVSASLTPMIAYKLTDRISVGAGMEFMYLDFSSKKMVNLPALVGGGSVDAKVAGDSLGYGFTGGIHVRLADWLSIGGSFRTQVKQTVKGTAKFKRPEHVAAVGAFNKTDAEGEIVLPAQFGVGVAIKPLDNLTVEFSALRVNWSSFRELKITYDNNILGPLANHPYVKASGLDGTKSVSRKSWKDTWRLGVGVEYECTDALTLRASYVYDQSPIRGDAMDTLIPGHDRDLYGAGFSYSLKDWTISASYTFLRARDLSGTNPDGIRMKYSDSIAHMVALSIGYRF